MVFATKINNNTCNKPTINFKNLPPIYWDISSMSKFGNFPISFRHNARKINAIAMIYSVFIQAADPVDDIIISGRLNISHYYRK